MADVARGILLSGILDSFRNNRRNPVCRVFIPGDTRMFDKLPKALKKWMAQEWEHFGKCQESEAEEAVNTAWFHRYLQYQTSIGDLYDFVQRNGEEGSGDTEFLKRLTDRAFRYGAEFSEDRSADFTEQERQCVFAFYGIGIRVLRRVLQEITPKAESTLISRIMRNPETAEVRILNNLMYEKLENDEMWWHIRYCIDHEIRGVEELMVNVAKNGQWKAWVRQAAAEYACRFMDVGTICIELLSGLHGKLFYWTAEQFIDTRDKRLKDQLRNYARYYTGQEMQQDVCLVKMQDKDGVRRICGYLERLKRMSRTVEPMDPILAIGEIESAELLEELGRLTDLLMRDDFRDRKWNGLQAALVSALARVASAGEKEYEQVMELMTVRAKRCGPGKRMEKLSCMVEDIRWRIRG